jgi:hypothetical protein
VAPVGQPHPRVGHISLGLVPRNAKGSLMDVGLCMYVSVDEQILDLP